MHYLSFTVIVGHKSRSILLAGWFWLWGSHEVAGKLSLGAAIMWKFRAKGSLPKTVQLNDCWLEAAVYCRLLICGLHTYLHGPFIQLLKHPHQITGSCPQRRKFKKKKKNKEKASVSLRPSNGSYTSITSITSTLLNLLSVSH